MTKYTQYIIAIVLVLGIAFYFFARKNTAGMYSTDEAVILEGQQIYARNCLSCHGIQDDGFGPPLGGITNLLSKEKLINFIKNPLKAMESGNERAVAMNSRYKRIMPPFGHLVDADIESILAYIAHETKLHQIAPLSLRQENKITGLTGRLVPPIKKSQLKITLEEVIELPQLDSTSNLGVVTLRPHPSGDGTLFASDQNGIIYSIANGKAITFLDMKEQIKDFQSGPGIATGLGSFDYHPDFLTNGLIYISHAETHKGQLADYAIASDSLQSEVQWVIAEWKMDDISSNTFNGTHRELLRLHAPTFAHGLQELAFIPELEKADLDYGLLYFGYGDGGSNNIHQPQLGHHLQSFLGTIMRIDPAGSNSRNGHYGIPESNPFANGKDDKIVKEIFAYGFRNPHHMSWDKASDNRMIATDIGEANLEELNIIENGGDYGWPNREGEYGIATLTDLKTVFKLKETDNDLYKNPFAEYDHEEGNAISGGYVYEGKLTALQNKYIFGDIVNGRLFYGDIDPQISDTAIYELGIAQNGTEETTLQELCNTKRLHLRVAYDHINKELYLITKHDSKIWRVTSAN